MKVEKTTLGAGCFWCVDAIFSSLKGVSNVEPGFSGGNLANPSYEEVYTDSTGHAEVCQITFNPDIISFIELLKVFWKIHDPTTPNRQGDDVGTRYRSVIFYHSNEQKLIAEGLKVKLNESNVWPNPIVTQVEPFVVFYRAENYHFNYFKNNPQSEYCSLVVLPKVEKFKKIFHDFLK